MNGQLLPLGSRMGAVHLSVTNRDRSLQFWSNAVGLTLLDESDGSLSLGAGGQELLVLTPGATSPVVPRRTGLYHVAIHLPTRRELAMAVARLSMLGIPNSPTDHTVSEATYLSDPDGHGIELTFETPERGELIVLPNRQPAARTIDGRLRGPSERVDLDSLLSELSDAERVDAPISAGAKVGHVHLHVSNLEESIAFYRDVIGFRLLVDFGEWRMADLSLDPKTVPHNLALNTWSGVGAPRPPAGSAQLLEFTIVTPQLSDLESIASRLGVSVSAGAVEFVDPSGNRGRVVSPG